MASSSSSESSTETPINSETRRPASCFLLSAANYQTPSMQPLFRPVFRHGLAMQELFHKSVASTVDQCVRALEGFVSGNPLLRRVLSLSSEFQSVCRQIHCRNSVSASLLSNHNFAAVLPGDSVAGLVAVNGINNFLNIYNTLLVVRLVLTWFPNAPPAIVSPLSTLCDPYLNIFRGIIPPLGGLDLSPILAFLVLNAFTSAAAALPAELPQNIASQENTKSGTSFTDLTTSQEKWLKRLSAQKSKSSSSSF